MTKSNATPVVSGEEHRVGRRDALAGAVALLALSPAAVRAQVADAATAPALDKVAFLDASMLVTGLPADKLTGMGDAIMAAFTPYAPAVQQLAALAKQNPPDLVAALKGTPIELPAKALALAWYTGTVGTGPAAKLLSYEDAAAWKAAGYEAVPGLCAGAFGAWSEPMATP